MQFQRLVTAQDWDHLFIIHSILALQTHHVVFAYDTKGLGIHIVSCNLLSASEVRKGNQLQSVKDRLNVRIIVRRPTPGREAYSKAESGTCAPRVLLWLLYGCCRAPALRQRCSMFVRSWSVLQPISSWYLKGSRPAACLFST